MTAPPIDPFEKLASFYLGRQYDLATSQLQDELLMYESKDLCTHALCVGMTGSGKTGLCVALLEEAALDGVPAICIDPKGDLANLMLAFPELRAKDFLPWLEQRDADRHGVSLESLAVDTATKWRLGLAKWGQEPQRIQRFKDAVDVAVYTPGSNAGLPLAVLKSFDAPPKALFADADAIRERVAGAVSGLLTLLDIQADPLLAPEHILVSAILDASWQQGLNVSLMEMIGLIQRPPFTRIGVLDIDSFMSPAERARLAMRLNNLIASPAFAAWGQGEPLSISRLLYTPEGKPRLAILSIAHLSDSERMFFVTVLLNELVAWMRTQSGTSSLRAILYMDEVAGYFPPTAKPPSKPPMMTLLKQARAYGLGVMLATQNPVDLDYKALSNIGTWFLGRLQTERDKSRVLEGLEGAAVKSGTQFDRFKMGEMLAALGDRVFLINNVHDDGPKVFQSRWAMSFLAGPMTRDKIRLLMAARKPSSGPTSLAPATVMARKDGDALETSDRPVVATEIQEKFLTPSILPADSSRAVYRAAIYAKASAHFVRVSADVDRWIDMHRLLPCNHEVPKDLWESSDSLSAEVQLDDQPHGSFTFAGLPDALRGHAVYEELGMQFKNYLYRHHALTLYKSPALGRYAPAGCSASDARLHFAQGLRELRDLESEKLRTKFAVRAKALEKQIRTASDRLAREQVQYRDATVHSAISIGSTILGAFLGRKLASQSNLSKTSSAVRGATRVGQAKSDVEHAEDAMRQLQLDLLSLDREVKLALEQIATKYDLSMLEMKEIAVALRKSDLKITGPFLLWTPWQVDAQGIATPLYKTER